MSFLHRRLHDEAAPILCLPLDYHAFIIGDKNTWQKIRYMKQRFSPEFDLAYVASLRCQRRNRARRLDR